MVVVGLVIAAAAAGDVGIAGVVGAAAAAAAAADVGIEFEFEFEFEFGVEAQMFDIDEIEVFDESAAVEEEGVGGEIVDNGNVVGVVVIEHVGREVADTAGAAAGAAAGVETVVAVVGIDVFGRYIVDAGIDEGAEDYVGAALERRS